MKAWCVPESGSLTEKEILKPTPGSAKPNHLSHAEAASVPIGALTAWQGLFDRAKLQSGETVLNQGGAGAVGVFAVQLAHSRGATVIATASARDLEFVKRLGADRVIDYQADAFEKEVRNVDVVFDTVGGVTLQKSWDVLNAGGRLVTIAASNEGGLTGRDKEAFITVEPSARQLTEIARRLDTGELIAVVDRVVTFSSAPDAFATGKKGPGKIVVASSG